MSVLVGICRRLFKKHSFFAHAALPSTVVPGCMPVCLCLEPACQCRCAVCCSLKTAGPIVKPGFSPSWFWGRGGLSQDGCLYGRCGGQKSLLKIWFKTLTNLMLGFLALLHSSAGSSSFSVIVWRQTLTSPSEAACRRVHWMACSHFREPAIAAAPVRSRRKLRESRGHAHGS